MAKATPPPKPPAKNCKPKKPRGPNRNGFIEFLKEARKRILKKNPKMTIGEVAKEAGCCWRKMKEEDKDEYRKRACKRAGTECKYCKECKRMYPVKKPKKK